MQKGQQNPLFLVFAPKAPPLTPAGTAIALAPLPR